MQNKITQINTVENSIKTQRRRITVGINNLTVAQQAAYSNHLQVFFRLGRNYLDTDFIFVNPMRMSIDRMRNLAAVTALESDSEYLLFIDDDVVIPSPFDFLDKLIACDADIACGDVLVRGYPFNHMIFSFTQNKLGLNIWSKIPKRRGVHKCDAVGFSLCLIRTSLLKRLTKPYFVTGPESNTEDIYFCIKAHQEYPEVSVKVDTSITCGHILWNELIATDNKKEYTTYYEALNGKPAKKDEANWRGKEYLHAMKGVLDVA